MTRDELITLIDAAPIDAAQKAIATIAVNIAPSDAIDEIGAVAEEGLAIMRYGTPDQFEQFVRAVATRNRLAAPIVDSLLTQLRNAKDTVER